MGLVGNRVDRAAQLATVRGCAADLQGGGGGGGGAAGGWCWKQGLILEVLRSSPHCEAVQRTCMWMAGGVWKIHECEAAAPHIQHYRTCMYTVSC
jgi:hypothetical protein